MCPDFKRCTKTRRTILAQGTQVMCSAACNACIEHPQHHNSSDAALQDQAETAICPTKRSILAQGTLVTRSAACNACIQQPQHHERAAFNESVVK